MKLVSLIRVVADSEISVSLILKHIIGHDPELVSFSHPILTACFHKIHLNVILPFPVCWYEDMHGAWPLPHYSRMKCLVSENVEQIFGKFKTSSLRLKLNIWASCCVFLIATYFGQRQQHPLYSYDTTHFDRTSHSSLMMVRPYQVYKADCIFWLKNIYIYI